MYTAGNSAADCAAMALVTITLMIGTAQAQQRATLDPFAAFSESLTGVPPVSTMTNSGQFYVPAFSSIRMGGGRTRLDLAVTLSIHNASEQKALVVNRIDYFDTSGTLVERYVVEPIAVRPFGTIEVFIAADDTRGGTGANFLVGWAAAGLIAEPVIEAVMVGTVGTAGYSFASPGRAVRIPEDEHR